MLYMQVSEVLFQEINTFIQQGCIELIKSDSKTFIMLQRVYISKKCIFFLLSTYPEDKMYHSLHNKY